MLQIVPGLLLVGNLRFVLLVDLSFSVLHFSSVVFQSRLTFVLLSCFFAFISVGAVRLVGCKREGVVSVVSVKASALSQLLAAAAAAAARPEAVRRSEGGSQR